MPTIQRFLVAALPCGALAACNESPTAPGGVPDASLQVTSITRPTFGPWARIVEGRTGPNSLYAIYVPRQWNGDAIVYVHGFRDADSPVDLRDQDNLFQVRDILGGLGYAFAYSSFDANGFVVKNGTQRTHQLSSLLTAELQGKPERLFLAAHSLGGGIGLNLVERFPSQYDGALLMCGIVGGSLLETQYLGHVRALFDFFYPGALPGDVVKVPRGTAGTLAHLIAAV